MHDGPRIFARVIQWRNGDARMTTREHADNDDRGLPTHLALKLTCMPLESTSSSVERAISNERHPRRHFASV